MVDANAWWNRLGAASGLVAFIAMVIGLGTTGFFDDGDIEPSDSAATIAHELADQSELAPVITVIGLLFFLWFLAYLRSHMRVTTDSWLTDVFFGGGLIYVAVMAGLIALQLALATSSFSSDPQIAKTLFVVQWNYSLLFGPPVIAAAGAAAVLSIRFVALPQWVGWVALVVALMGLLPWIGFIGLVLWSAIVSVTLLVQQFQSAPDVHAATPS